MLTFLIACSSGPASLENDNPTLAYTGNTPSVDSPGDTTDSTPDSPDGDSDSPVDSLVDSTVDSPVDSVVVPAAPPVACAESIYVPQVAYDPATAVLADAHAETYGAAPAPLNVHLTWPADPSTSIAMLWKTDSDTLASTVEIGQDTSYGTTLTGGSFPLGEDAEVGRAHEVHVCGLTPGSTWHYRVGGAGGYSADFQFTVAPAVGSTEKIRFGLAGDSRGDPTTWNTVLLGLQSRGVEFIVFTGDAVSSGSDVAAWEDWFDAGAGILEGLPILMVHGNHEGLQYQYFALFSLPVNEQWYSYDYGNVHFSVLNDSPSSSSTTWPEEAAWLASDLAVSTQTWKFTAHHKPGYTSAVPNGPDASYALYAAPVLEAGGVQMDFAGHNHNYERSYPMREGAVSSDPTAVNYIVSAGAGASLYSNLGEQPYTAIYNVIEHYTVIEVEGDSLQLYAYDLAGNVIDSYHRTATLP